MDILLKLILNKKMQLIVLHTAIKTKVLVLVLAV